MADSSFGLKIGLEGEREFKRAITEINREMRVLGSEMKLAASAFERNETSAVSLTATNQVLAKEIDAQRSKVETLRAALDNAASSFGESDSRTKNWQIQLNNAQAALNDLEKELAGNNDALEQFASRTDEAGDDAQDAARQADRLEDAVDGLGDEMDDASGKTRLFGDVLKANLASEAIVASVKGIASAVAGLAKGMVGVLKDGVEYNARMEHYTTSFTTMLGDQAKAQQLVNDLKKEAARTPFGMEDLAKNTQVLLGFGLSAQEAQLRLGQLGDISQGDAVKLESLTLAFAQMSSTGKLTGQDLNQMINAGFNPLEEISRKTGKSIGELKEEMAKGAISADMVADAFASATSEGGRFYGAMQAQSTTFSGQLATLQDGVDNLKGVLAAGLTDTLASTVLPMVNGWVDQLTQAFETGGAPALIDTFGQILQEALAFISEQLPQVVDAGVQILTSLVEGIISVLPSLAETAVQLVTALLTAIIDALPLLLEAAIQVVATLAMGLADALPELIPAAIGMLTALVQGLVDNLPLLLDAALQLIMGLAEGLLAALPVLIEALPQIIAGIVEFLVNGIPQLIQTGIELLTALVGALPEIMTAIVAALPQIITSIVTGLLGAIPQIIEAGIDLLTALIAALPQIITTIIAALPQIIAAIVTAIGNSIPQLVQAGIELLSALVTGVPRILGTVLAAIGQLLAGVVGAVIDGVPRMVSAGGDLVRGLWDGIQTLTGWLWDNVVSWCQGIWDGITDFFGIHSPSTEMAWIGDMLTRGLAGGIEATGHRAVTAAKDVATDALAAMDVLTSGVDVPIETRFDAAGLAIPELSLAPVAVTVQHAATTSPASDVDAVAVIDATARRILGSLDLQVVLSDGTLVGKLAPGINQRLARLSNHHTVLTGGGMMRGFTLNTTTTSTSLGLRLTAPVEIPTAQRIVDDIEVTGRAGTLTRLGGWADTILTLPLAVPTTNGFEVYRTAALALTEATTISFTGEPGLFRHIKHVEVSPLRREMASWGFFDATLTCAPFTYLTSGLTKHTLTSSGTLTNPGLLTSEPVITVYGTGQLTLTINGTAHRIHSPAGQVTLDAARQVAHVTGRAAVDALAGNFPVLQPGTNRITLGAGISRIEVVGNWRGP